MLVVFFRDRMKATGIDSGYSAPDPNSSSLLLTTLPISPPGELFRKALIVCVCPYIAKQRKTPTGPHILFLRPQLLELINTRHTYEQTSSLLQAACRRRTIYNPALPSSSHKKRDEEGKTHLGHTPPFSPPSIPVSFLLRLRLQNAQGPRRLNAPECRPLDPLLQVNLHLHLDVRPQCPEGR